MGIPRTPWHRPLAPVGEDRQDQSADAEKRAHKGAEDADDRRQLAARQVAADDRGQADHAADEAGGAQADAQEGDERRETEAERPVGAEVGVGVEEPFAGDVAGGFGGALVGDDADVDFHQAGAGAAEDADRLPGLGVYAAWLAFGGFDFRLDVELARAGADDGDERQEVADELAAVVGDVDAAVDDQVVRAHLVGFGQVVIDEQQVELFGFDELFEAFLDAFGDADLVAADAEIAEAAVIFARPAIAPAARFLLGVPAALWAFVGAFAERFAALRAGATWHRGGCFALQAGFRLDRDDARDGRRLGRGRSGYYRGRRGRRRHLEDLLTRRAANALAGPIVGGRKPGGAGGAGNFHGRSPNRAG